MNNTKEKTIEILNKHIKEKANLEHCLMVGYGMKGVSKYLKLPEEKQEEWFLIGALHDIDIEKYNGDINVHCLVGEKILQEEGISQEIIDIIKSHNDALKIERKETVEHALFSVDGLTGIIRAYVLMRPDKEIKNAETKSIIKKFKDKTFAAAISREEIRLCETKLNIPLNEFITAVLEEIKINMDFK
jgi:putative nucleotidyltransferase with HDIG domain